MTTRATDITLAIIAGGAGTRMGIPKHALTIHGEPILGALLRRLRWPGPTLLVVSTDRPVVAGQERCDRVVCDGVADQGPLRGILTALDTASTEALIAVPIDMPELGCRHLDWLRGLADVHREASCIMLRDDGGQIQPFPSLCRRGLIPSIAALLDAGRRSLHALADLPGAHIQPAPTSWSPRVWTNLNTPPDLVGYISSTPVPIPGLARP